MTRIHEDEWAAEVERLTVRLHRDDGWLSLTELASRLGRSRDATLRLIRAGIANKKYEAATGLHADSLGRMASAKCYRVKK